MTNIPCSIILDLLPSYVDGLCSEESNTLVEKHLEGCEGCRKACEALQAPVEVDALQKQENLKSVNPLKKIRKEQFYRVGFAVLLTLVLVVSAAAVVQEVGVVNDFFFPMQTAILRSHQPEAVWQDVHYAFSDEALLTFDSIFFKVAVVNDGTVSAGDVTIRFKDADGNIVLDNVYVPYGREVKLDLKRFTPYRVEVLAAEGDYFLNFV